MGGGHTLAGPCSPSGNAAAQGDAVVGRGEEGEEEVGREVVEEGVEEVVSRGQGSHAGRRSTSRGRWTHSTIMGGAHTDGMARAGAGVRWP